MVQHRRVFGRCVVTDILIIPDPHAQPGKDNDRAEWAGKLIADIKPKVVVNLGDVAEFGSLSSFETIKASNYRDDSAAAVEFEDKLWHHAGQAGKDAKKIILEGNQERRATKAVEERPELEGTITLKDLQREKYYDRVVGYAGSSPGQIRQNGITFAHFIPNMMGRAIQSVHHAHALINKTHGSVAVGHSHCFDFKIHPTNNSKKLFGLVAGCFIEARQTWAGVNNNLWWRGVCVLRDVQAGQYDLQTISLNSLKAEYSNPTDFKQKEAVTLKETTNDFSPEI